MRSTIFLFLAIALAACEPIGPVPGSGLSGAPGQVPDSWSHTAAVEVFQLETTPEDPYSVNIWGVGIDGEFYIAAGDGGTTRWAEALVDDPRVRLRVDDTIYELTASPIADAQERTIARTAYIAKYELDPDTVPVDEFALYRLEARSP
jgi:hypothetical protein